MTDQNADLTRPTLSERLSWRFRRWRMAHPQDGLHAHDPSAPLVVAGLFSTASGIGESARICARALKHLGFDVIEIDLSSVFNQSDLSHPKPVMQLPRTPRGTLILHVNGPETERALFAMGLHRTPGWRVVGYWAWELECIPNSWLAALPFLSEIWTPSDYVSATFQDHVDIPVRTVPHAVQQTPVQSCDHQPLLPDFDGTTILVAADGRSSFYRKNVIGALNMFKLAADGRDDMRLIVKSRNLQEYSGFADQIQKETHGDARIHVIEDTLSHISQKALIQASDIVLSAHRAEGFGLHLAEAMALGRPVIATNWSGNTQFMNDQNSLLVNYEFERVNDPFNIYSGFETARWANPSLRMGVEALRALTNDAELRAQVGGQAAHDVAKTLRPQAYLGALNCE